MCQVNELLASQALPPTTKQQLGPDPGVFAKLHLLLLPTYANINAGRYHYPIEASERARSISAASEARNCPYLLYVNQPYGLALMRLGRAALAIAPLKKAVDTLGDMSHSDISQIQTVYQGLQSGMAAQLLRVENTRQAASSCLLYTSFGSATDIAEEI